MTKKVYRLISGLALVKSHVISFFFIPNFFGECRIGGSVVLVGRFYILWKFESFSFSFREMLSNENGHCTWLHSLTVFAREVLFTVCIKILFITPLVLSKKVPLLTTNKQPLLNSVCS